MLKKYKPIKFIQNINTNRHVFGLLAVNSEKQCVKIDRTVINGSKPDLINPDSEYGCRALDIVCYIVTICKRMVEQSVLIGTSLGSLGTLI